MNKLTRYKHIPIDSFSDWCKSEDVEALEQEHEKLKALAHEFIRKVKAALDIDASHAVLDALMPGARDINSTLNIRGDKG